VNTTLEAPLELHLSGVQVLPATHNVRMQVRITNRQFLSSVSAIKRKEEADYTEDTIDTVFTAAPGDIIVLAGLTSAEDGNSSTGLPGITGAAPGLGGLLGGSDQITNKLSEMVVFLAPTVIDPASDPQPHAAFSDPVTAPR
jgi:type II secretory pathway component GspD/PulD (secretin)